MHRLVASLYADAVGFSSLMAKDSRAALASLEHARATVRRCSEAAESRIVETAGDSVGRPGLRRE
jgi:class 3 adenylate cyclase